MSIALAQAGSASIEPTTITRMMICLTLHVPGRDYGVAAGGSGMICTLSPSAKFTGGCSTT